MTSFSRGIIIIGATGILLNGIILFVENRVVPWKGKRLIGMTWKGDL